MERPIVIAFSSSEGHSKRIAEHLAARIADNGWTATLIDVKADRVRDHALVHDGNWVAALIVASIHLGVYDPELFAFVSRHARALENGPSAFLSVSLSAASDDLGELMAVDDIAHHLFIETGWLPGRLMHVAGAVNDAKLNILKRTALHAILRAKGITPSPTGYTEFTDWDSLDTFVDELTSGAIET